MMGKFSIKYNGDRMIYVLGYGNPLRGDDGLGCAAALELQKTWESHPHVQIETAHQLTPEMAMTLSEFEYAVFLDVQANGEPGQIIVREIGASVEHESPLNHHCSPESLLQSAGELFGNAPSLHMYSIVGVDFGYHETLSESVRNALPHYLDLINCFIRERML
jgi:hydrogenase maturation protease